MQAAPQTIQNPDSTVKRGRNFKDISGQRFNRLEALEPCGKNRHQIAWMCRCDCGKEVVVCGTELRSGKTGSCGCLHRDATGNAARTHGESRSPAYKSWSDMKSRCSNPNRPDFSRYGGRGISVCPRWEKFENFLADMGGRPESTSLDRIDNSGNYEPSNCRWANAVIQANNKRSAHRLYYDGKNLTIAEWARLSGLKMGTLWNRVKLGWSIDRAITQPQRKSPSPSARLSTFKTAEHWRL